MSKREKFVIDASGQVVGRIATKIAMALLGKNRPDFQYHIDSGDKVVVLNVAEVRFTGKKMATKEYKHHSMHPGGLKIRLAKDVAKADPKELIILAVSKMLPKNKTRSARLKRISFK